MTHEIGCGGAFDLDDVGPVFAQAPGRLHTNRPYSAVHDPKASEWIAALRLFRIPGEEILQRSPFR